MIRIFIAVFSLIACCINVIGCSSASSESGGYNHIVSLSSLSASEKFHDTEYARWRIEIIDPAKETKEYRSAVLEIDNQPGSSRNTVSVKVDVFKDRCTGVPFTSVSFTQTTRDQMILPQYMEFTSNACIKMYFYTDKNGFLNLEDQVVVKLTQ